SDALKTYYDDYLSSLTVPSRELFHAGCFTMYTEVISYHLLSMYLLLDLIDYYWDGKKFLNHKMEKKPSLWNILSGDSATSFKQIEKMKKTLFTLQRLSRKHRLHVFLIPLKSKNDYSLEITYPGNVLIIFPKSSKSDNKGEQPKIVDVLQRG